MAWRLNRDDQLMQGQLHSRMANAEIKKALWDEAAVSLRRGLERLAAGPTISLLTAGTNDPEKVMVIGATPHGHGACAAADQIVATELELRHRLGIAIAAGSVSGELSKSTCDMRLIEAQQLWATVCGLRKSSESRASTSRAFHAMRYWRTARVALLRRSVTGRESRKSEAPA